MVVFFPSPLVGEGAHDTQYRGRVRGFSPRMQTPHPSRTSSAPPSPTRGEGKKTTMTAPDLPAELKAALDARLQGLSRTDAAGRAALISKTARRARRRRCATA